MKLKTFIKGGVVAAGLYALPVQAQSPMWWSGGLLTNSDSGNYSPANVGQAKNMVTLALLQVRQENDEVAGRIEARMQSLFGVDGLTVPLNPSGEWYEKQKVVLLNGQLKAIVAAFYEELNSVYPNWLQAERIRLSTNHPGSIYPWTGETDDDSHYSPALIGQLKACFAFRMGVDGPNDSGLDDTTDVDPLDGVDSDQDGLPDWFEALHGTLNPNMRDSDGDGIIDALEEDPMMTSGLTYIEMHYHH